jgi:hypothetical protein
LKSSESPTVVFVCLHGSAKSLIAAQYFTRLAQERGLRYDAASAGLEPDAAVPEPVVLGLRRDGFDVSDYVPRHVRGEQLANAARVVTFGCELPVASGLRSVESWNDLPMVSDGFDTARDAIVSRVKLLVDTLA